MRALRAIGAALVIVFVFIFIFAAQVGVADLDAQTPDAVRVTAARANVRSKPSIKGTILTTVAAGTRLEVRGVQGEWYQVAASVGTTRVIGYIAKSVVAADKPASGGPPLAPTSGATAATAPTTRRATASMPAGLTVSVEVNGKAQPLGALTSRVVKIARRVNSASAAAIAMPIGSGDPLPASASSSITYVWVLDDVAGVPVLEAQRPVISLQFREVPGLNADEVTPVLVRLVGTAAGPRVVSAARGRVDQMSRDAADWDLAREWKHEVVKAAVLLTRRGIATVTPTEDLPPGDYAIVLRPSGSKRFAGTSVLSDQEEGRIFGLVWAWRVK